MAEKSSSSQLINIFFPLITHRQVARNLIREIARHTKWARYKVADGPYPRFSRRMDLQHPRLLSHPSESAAIRERIGRVANRVEEKAALENRKEWSLRFSLNRAYSFASARAQRRRFERGFARHGPGTRRDADPDVADSRGTRRLRCRGFPRT